MKSHIHVPALFILLMSLFMGNGVSFSSSLAAIATRVVEIVDDIVGSATNKIGGSNA